MKRFIGRLGWRFALSTVATLAVAGGIAYAAIPDSGTSTYHACMLKNFGTIRIIDPSLPTSSLLQHCTSLETAITFNQQGAKGDPGTPGLRGASGTPGAPGSPGGAGATGAAGQSVTEANATPADCANGGVALTAANGTGFVCNGNDGKDGKDGKDGTNGAPGADGTNGSGLATIEDLNGIGCTDVNGAASTVAVSLAPDGSVNLKCATVPPVPPPPPPVTLTPNNFIVGTQASRAVPLTLTNTSSASVTLDPINGVSSTTCGTQLAAGATCQIVINVGSPPICEDGDASETVTGTDANGHTFTVTAEGIVKGVTVQPCP